MQGQGPTLWEASGGVYTSLGDQCLKTRDSDELEAQIPLGSRPGPHSV